MKKSKIFHDFDRGTESTQSEFMVISYTVIFLSDQTLRRELIQFSY